MEEYFDSVFLLLKFIFFLIGMSLEDKVGYVLLLVEVVDKNGYLLFFCDLLLNFVFYVYYEEVKEYVIVFLYKGKV